MEYLFKVNLTHLPRYRSDVELHRLAIQQDGEHFFLADKMLEICYLDKKMDEDVLLNLLKAYEVLSLEDAQAGGTDKEERGMFHNSVGATEKATVFFRILAVKNYQEGVNGVYQTYNVEQYNVKTSKMRVRVADRDKGDEGRIEAIYDGMCGKLKMLGESYDVVVEVLGCGRHIDSTSYKMVGYNSKLVPDVINL